MNAPELPREEMCNHQKEKKQKRIVSGIHRVKWKWPVASSQMSRLGYSHRAKTKLKIGGGGEAHGG